MSLKGSAPGYDGIKLGPLFKSLKCSTPGYDGIKLGPLNIVMLQLTKSLVPICNMSLQEVELANTVPLYKK